MSGFAAKLLSELLFFRLCDGHGSVAYLLGLLRQRSSSCVVCAEEDEGELLALNAGFDRDIFLLEWSKFVEVSEKSVSVEVLDVADGDLSKTERV